MKNNIGAKQGDLVEIKAVPKKILKYTLIAYMIPFLMLIMGIVLGVNYFQSIGVENYEMYGFGIGMVFLAISYLIIKFIDRYFDKKGVSDFIRVTIGKDKDMDVFLLNLKDILAQNSKKST